MKVITFPPSAGSYMPVHCIQSVNMKIATSPSAGVEPTSRMPSEIAPQPIKGSFDQPNFLAAAQPLANSTTPAMNSEIATSRTARKPSPNSGPPTRSDIGG